MVTANLFLTPIFLLFQKHSIKKKTLLSPPLSPLYFHHYNFYGNN